jgi:hypothetical protein
MRTFARFWTREMGTDTRGGMGASPASRRGVARLRTCPRPDSNADSRHRRTAAGNREISVRGGGAENF